MWLHLTFVLSIAVGNIIAVESDLDSSSDPYVFETTTLPSNLRYLPSVGNGHLATNVYTSAIFINGLYNGETGWSHRAQVPSFHASNLSVSEHCSNSTTTRTYRLNLKDGFYEEVIQLSDDVTITYRTYAHQFYSRLLVTEVHIDRSRCTITSTCCNISNDFVVQRTSLNVDPVELDFTWNNNSTYNGTGFCASSSCYQQSGAIAVPETATTPRSTVYIYWNDMPTNFTVPANISVLRRTFVVAADKDISDFAKADFDSAMKFLQDNRAEELLANHTASFNQIWLQGDIEIEGDLQLQKVVRGCLYYIYTSLPSQSTNSPPNQFYGLSPGGLPNGANHTDYQGHVFWDMETWMYPAIMMFRPDLGRDMLSYRIHGIVPAIVRAAEGGYAGARFPWESAQTGVEVTPVICIPCRENQQHITGDIAFAARQYVSATRDLDWLNTPQAGTVFTGFDFIRHMAQFWNSRPRLNQTTDRYDINGVMPPDEHVENANNSIYTNVMASYAIHFARYAACLAGRNAVDEIPDSWLRVAQRLAFPFNSAKRYHEEYDGYDYQRETNTTDVRGIKQADVVMLGFPLLWTMPDDVRANDLVHYENVTNQDGPAMTWGVFSTGWLDLQDVGNADRLFDKSYRLYVREPFKVWTEVQSGDGAINFITGMGGFLQTVIFGYSGLRLNIDNLQLRKARLPPGSTKVTLRGINYLGTEFDVQFTDSTIQLAVTSAGSISLQLTKTVPAETVPFNRGFNHTFSVQEMTLTPTQSNTCPPIESPEIDVEYMTSSPLTTVAAGTNGVSSLRRQPMTSSLIIVILLVTVCTFLASNFVAS